MTHHVALVENYAKAGSEAVENVPACPAAYEGEVVRIASHTKMQRTIAHIVQRLQTDASARVALVGVGNAVCKCVSIAEIVRRRVKDLHQLNFPFCTTLVELWHPLEGATPGLDSLKVSRRQPSLRIVFTRLPVDSRLPGYQAPLPPEALELNADGLPLDVEDDEDGDDHGFRMGWPREARACVQLCRRLTSSRVGSQPAPDASVALVGARFRPDGSSNALREEDPHLPSARPLVLLHGLFGQHGNLRTLAKQLAAQAQRDVLALDLRNHGESPWSSAMSYNRMAEDVVRAVGVHAEGPVTLVGHSMGGKCAMTVALCNPDLVERLVVVDIAPVIYPTMRQARLVSEAMRNVPLEGPDAISTRVQADLYMRRSVKDDVIRRFALTNFIPASKDGTPARWRVNLPVIHESMSELASFPILPGTAHVFAKPTLFAYGLKSDYVVDAQQPTIQALFPQAHLRAFDAGHWLHSEAPEAFAAAVVVFLV